MPREVLGKVIDEVDDQKALAALCRVNYFCLSRAGPKLYSWPFLQADNIARFFKYDRQVCFRLRGGRPGLDESLTLPDPID